MTSEIVSLEVGQMAPDFEAELTNGDKIILSEALSSGEKIILYFLLGFLEASLIQLRFENHCRYLKL